MYAIAGGWETVGAIYVGGVPGLFRSRDCGRSWDAPWDPDFIGPFEPLTWIIRLATAPGGRIYAGTIGTIWASDDSGVRWRRTYGPGNQLGLGASPADPNTAYVFGWSSGAPAGSHSAERAASRTTDGGLTWQGVKGPPQDRGMPGRGTLPAGFALVDPADPSIVYVIGNGIVWRSTDGASTFEYHGTYDSNATSSGQAAVSADGSRMWLVSSSGFYVSRDRGGSWQHFPGMPFTPVAGVATSPHDPEVLFVLVPGDEVWMYREPSGNGVRPRGAP